MSTTCNVVGRNVVGGEVARSLGVGLEEPLKITPTPLIL